METAAAQGGGMLKVEFVTAFTPDIFRATGRAKRGRNLFITGPVGGLLFVFFGKEKYPKISHVIHLSATVIYVWSRWSLSCELSDPSVGCFRACCFAHHH
jgi:hypothetical protein